jgi:cytochrome c oxidase cbb3-type subunit 3
LATSDGKKQYEMYCSACHGLDGSGTAALGAPALNDDIWLYGGSPSAIRASISGGRTGVMPPFVGRLEPAQIKMLVAWLGRDRTTDDLTATR